MTRATGLTIALVALAALATLGEGGGSVGALLAWHSALLAIVLAVLLAPDPEGRRARPHRRLAPFVAVFLTLALAGALRAPYAYAAWLVLVELAAFGAVFFLSSAASTTRDPWPRWIAPVLLAVAFAHGVTVVYQAAVLGRTRPAGSFLNTNHMSAWLVMTLLFAVPWWMAAPRRQRVAAAVLALPVLGALLVSSSRGALLGAAAGGAWLLAVRFRDLDQRARAAVVGVAVIGVAVVGWRQVERVRDDPFIHHRPLIWQSSLAVLAENPLWGSGPGQFPVAAAAHRFEDGHGPLRYDRTFRATHSDWLRGPVEFGAPAGLALGALVAVFVVAVLGRRRTDAASPFDDGAFAALVALGAQALVDNPSRWPAAWLLAAFFAGRLAAVPREAPAARFSWPARAATALVVLVCFLAGEVAPTVAWFRAAAPQADTARLRAAVRLNPRQPMFWSRLAQRELPADANAARRDEVNGTEWLERYGEAREHAERAMRLQPADARYRLTVAEVEARGCLARFRDTACRARVLDAFAAAATRSPFDATIPLEAAEFAHRAGDSATARGLVDRALGIEPNAVPARLLLADVLLAGPRPQAAEALRLVDEAEAISARYPGPAKKSGYARVLLGFDAARAADLRRRAAVVAPASAGRADERPKALTYARRDQDRPTTASP